MPFFSYQWNAHADRQDTYSLVPSGNHLLASFGERTQGDVQPDVIIFRRVLRTSYVYQYAMHYRWLVGIDSDRIRMETEPNVTIYHILIRIRIRIRILSDTNKKRIVRIRIYIQILI
jgi:hypothetical protein